MSITETQSILDRIFTNATVAFAGDKVKETYTTATKQAIKIGEEIIVFCTVSPINTSNKTTVIWGFENE